MSGPDGDIGVTALYTSGVWRWAGLPGSELLVLPAARRVFVVVNLVLAVAGLLRRLPSLRHGLVQRHRMLDRLVQESGCGRVLELAAGLSPRGVTLSERLEVVELDLPAMVAQKRALLEASDAGRAVLARPGYRLVAGDAESVDLDALLPGPAPVFVVVEGLLMYLPVPRRRALWARLAAFQAARPGSVLAFDFVPACELPPQGLVGRFLAALMRLFTGGRGFERDEEDRARIEADLRAAGFERVRCLEPRDQPDLPFLDRRTQQLVWLCEG